MQNANSKVYITAPSGTDVSNLKNILNQRGLDVLSFHDEATMGDRWLHTLQNLIRKADIVFAVLGDSANANVMFELGFSASLNKKLVIIGHSRTPFHLSEFAHLTTDISDERALEFQLDALLKNLDQIEAPLFHEDIKPSNRLPRSRESKTLNRAVAAHSQSEEKLLQLLEASSEIDSVVVEPILSQTTDFRPDFAFRFSSEEKNLAGPIAVELKVTNQGHIRREWISQITDYASNLRPGVGLLVVDGPSENPLRVVNGFPLVFVIGFEELRELLLYKNGALEFRRARNKFIHSASNHA